MLVLVEKCRSRYRFEFPKPRTWAIANLSLTTPHVKRHVATIGRFSLRPMSPQLQH